MSPPIPAAGAVILRGDDVLLVKRGKPPLAGSWSLPGGRIEPGERASAAAVREAREETGCEIELIGLIDAVDWIDPSGETHFVLIDYAARWVSGEPAPGDDASESRFFSPQELDDLELWSETRRVIIMARKMAYSAQSASG